MEPIRQADVVTLDHVSRVAEARRTARRASERLGLPEEAMGRAELVAVELANNIVQHATGAPQGVTAHVREERRPRAAGKLFVSSDPAGADRPARVQIVAVDQGPGMASVERCLQDGFTTRSTPGLGLGAVYRLSEQADVFSELGSGTVVSALVGSRSEGGYFGEAGQGTAVLSTALEGEQRSGDNWAIAPGSGGDVYMLVDGLGHGLHASEAAGVATRFFLSALAEDPAIPVVQLLERMNLPMRATRGGAIAIVTVDRTKGKVTCCGIGNVSCLLHLPNGSTQSMVSHNGTLGHQMRRVQEFSYRYDKGTLLVMHSDGLSANWKLSSYRGLVEHMPATIAGVLYRDCSRPRDDATVLVGRLD